MEFLKSLVDIYPVFMGILALIAIPIYIKDLYKLYKSKSLSYEFKYKVLMTFLALYLVLRGFNLLDVIVF